MTLKEKFENAPKIYNQNLESFTDYTSIADEFAIGFAEWLIKRETKYFESLKQLLEIYKKEKEL